MDIDAEAEACLLSYSWPGNVRELHNVIKRACILAENGLITLADLPSEVTVTRLPMKAAVSDCGEDCDLRSQMRRYEAELIRRAIAAARGDRRLAARRLGISLSSLYGKTGEQGRTMLYDPQKAVAT